MHTHTQSTHQYSKPPAPTLSRLSMQNPIPYHLTLVLHMGLKNNKIISWDWLSQFFCPQCSLSLSLSVKLGLTCLRYGSLNNPTVSLFLWHIFVFFRLPIIYIYLYCSVYTPHPPSLLKHFYLYTAKYLSKITVVHVGRKRSGYDALMTLFWTSDVDIFKDPRVLRAFSSALKQNGMEGTGVCHDDTITSIN